MAAKISPSQLQYYEQHASDNQQPNLIATIVLCLALPCIAVFLRYLARWRMRAGYGWDDWLIALAILPCAGMSTTTGLGVRFGEGKHIIFVNNPAGFVKIYVAGIVVYSLTVIFIKLSILYLYHRIFPSKDLLIAASGIAALVLAYNAALIIFAFLQCIPLSTLWTGNPNGKCVSTQPAFITLAVMNVVTDIMILCLPIKFVIRLHMKTVKKLQVLVAFGLGGIVCVFGIVRSYYVGQASSMDQSWTATPGAIWSQVEISVGIISACLPVYRPLFMKRQHGSHSGYSDNSSKQDKTSRSIPLNTRSKGREGRSEGVSGGDHEWDVEERPFVKLPDSPTTAKSKPSLTNARHMYDSS